jgi:hypothetical protein
VRSEKASEAVAFGVAVFDADVDLADVQFSDRLRQGNLPQLRVPAVIAKVGRVSYEMPAIGVINMALTSSLSLVVSTLSKKVFGEPVGNGRQRKAGAVP